MTVAVELMPSPQSIVAEKSAAVPSGLASVNEATAPVNDVPTVRVRLVPVGVDGASATLGKPAKERPPLSSEANDWTVL